MSSEPSNEVLSDEGNSPLPPNSPPDIGRPARYGVAAFPGQSSILSGEASVDRRGIYHGLKRPAGGSPGREQQLHRFKKYPGSTTVHHNAMPHYVIVHQVFCDHVQVDGEDHQQHPMRADYLDTPRLWAHDTRGSVLRGRHPVPDIEEYCEVNPGVCMIVYRTYSCGDYHRLHADSFESFATGIDRQVFNKMRPWYFKIVEDGPPAITRTEQIRVISDVLCDAMDAVTAQGSTRASEWKVSANLTAPYDYFYHFRHQLRQHATSRLGKAENNELNVLLDFVNETQGAEFDEIDALFKEGKVRRDCLAKLFGPNEMIVTMRDGYPCASIAKTSVLSTKLGINLECWSWKFDGGFRRVSEMIHVSWPDIDASILPLTDLVAWPLRLDQSGLKQRLQRRGEEFWSCRHKKFVSYLAPTKTIFELQTANPKYMIDFNTYRQMHPSKELEAPTSDTEMRAHGIDMSSKEPPGDKFCILLPPTMLGYGFHDKKWSGFPAEDFLIRELYLLIRIRTGSLSIEHVHPVEWNTKAFSRVVLKSSKKELIKALVMVHINGKQSADVVEDKGNGLIVLLHGSPGTGKTLTAESVAEIAQKPLYRVTCGDIGTDAEVVEKYLESVLLVGTIWGCVVLLDEADIFLEERQPTDLARNALVSVFLRILEYYNGILILTSNRVGTFDEAFKSRVQLAIHYPALNEDGRFEIWRNFITMLKEKDVHMNFEELDRKVPVLARNELNGRQIRNLIWTAGQLARYKKEPLEYTHLEQVIEIANEFECYLKETHGQTDEEYAKAQGNRIS